MAETSHLEQSESKSWPPSCFICKGTHQASECAQKATLCDFQAKLRVNSEVEYGTVETNISLAKNVRHPYLRALKYLSAFQKRVEETIELMDCRFMYVEAWVNHKVTINTIVDFGATQASRCRKDEDRQFDSFTHLRSCEKNSHQAGDLDWTNWLCDSKMDDFDIVLGMVFVLEHKVIPMPLAKSLIITGPTQ